MNLLHFVHRLFRLTLVGIGTLDDLWLYKYVALWSRILLTKLGSLNIFLSKLTPGWPLWPLTMQMYYILVKGSDIQIWPWGELHMLEHSCWKKHAGRNKPSYDGRAAPWIFVQYIRPILMFELKFSTFLSGLEISYYYTILWHLEKKCACGHGSVAWLCLQCFMVRNGISWLWIRVLAKINILCQNLWEYCVNIDLPLYVWTSTRSHFL